MVVKSRSVHYKERARTEANPVLFSTFIANVLFVFQALTVISVTPIVQLDFRKVCLPHRSTTVSDVFADFQKFCKLEKLGSHKEKCRVDSFCPQINEIFAKIC